MNDVSVVDAVFLIWAHFVGDFILQTDEMAINKSKSNKWLVYHVGIYSLVLLPWGLWFAAVNVALHFVTDYFSSRLSSYFWKAEKRHEFFVVIGADQALHMTALIVTVSIQELLW